MPIGLIQSCPLAYRCPKRWENLKPTDVPAVRFCSACSRDVHLVSSQDDLRRFKGTPSCIAIPDGRTYRVGESA